MSVFQWLLVGTTICLQVIILLVMAKRKSRNSFPYFFNFIIFSFLSFVLQAIVVSRIKPELYFYIFWIQAGVSAILSFTVTYEVFVHILKPYSALVDFGKLIFRWAFLFLVLVSLLMALGSGGSEANRICVAIQLFARSTQLMLCGLLLLLLFFESRLGLSWRSPAVCIMLGFGLNATLGLLTPFLSDQVPNWGPQIAMAVPLVCIVVYGVWCASLVLPQPQRQTVQDSPTRLILQRWNEALLATPLVRRNNEAALPVESFLPGVERAVERVMARRISN